MNNKNLLNNETVDYTMNDTENILETKECKDIWKRKCPKCKTEIIYGGNRPRSAMKRAEKNKSSCKACAQLGLTHQNRNPNSFKRGKDHWNYGNNMPKESIERMRKSLTGKKLPAWVVEKMIKSRTGQKRTLQTRTKQRKSAIEALKKRGIFRGYNELACEYFDKLNKQFGWNLQHAKNGGEVELIGYFPDAYDKEKNIIVEYDEPHHYDIYGKLRERDVKRMNDLMRETDCKFYRYNEKLGRMNEYINELKP